MSDEIKVQSKNKKTKLIIVIAAVVIAVLAIVVIMLVSSNGATAKKVKEQLSLGDKYLAELQYEQAIAAYELAIEIDPKCEEAYLGLAEVYMATGDLDKAKEILDEAEDALGKETEGIESLRKKIKKREEKTSQEEQISPDNTVQTPDGTPIPNAPKMIKGTFKLQTTLDGVCVEAENFKVTQNDATGEVQITLGGVSIQDSYITNKSTSGENYLEYGWHVNVMAENYKYEISTSSWAYDPGQEMRQNVAEMQHSIWEYDEEESSWKSIGRTEAEYTSESITWIFIMPEGYMLDIREIQEYEIGITDDCQMIEMRQYTPSTEGTMTSTPALMPSPTLQPTATPTLSPTPLPTATPTPSPTPLPTATPSPSPTPRPTATPTPSPSPTPTPLPFPNTSDVTVSEPVVFSLPEEDSEKIVLFDVEQESSAVEVTIFSESGTFDANVSYYIGKTLADGTVESVGELGISLYASDAFKKNTTKSFYLAEAGQYGIYIRNAVSYNPQYYSGTNANDLQVTYKILPADINEPNGTEDTATQITEDEYCFFNLLGEADTDYFVLELTEDYDKLEVSIISETGTFDSKIVYSVSRYNEESEKMESVGSVWGMYAMNAFNRNSTKIYKINGAGTYYIEVTNAANANSLYYGGDNETYLAIKCKGIKE